MTTHAFCVALCLLAGYITNSRGLQLTMDRTIDDLYCGQLQCLSDITTTDTNVLSIVGLTIYDNTKVSDPIKLVSATIFAPDPQVEPSKEHIVNVTGRVSAGHAELTVRFQSQADCLYPSFLCELDFVNASGKPEVKAETVSPQEGDDCGIYASMLSKQLALMTAQIKSNSDDRQEQYKEYKQETDQRFNALMEQLSSIQSDLSSSREQQQSSCLKGQPHRNGTKRFTLWEKTTALCDTITDEGGWVIIQRRINNHTSFYRGWNDYRNFFGDLDTNFWVGNDAIHRLATEGYNELRVEIVYLDRPYYAHYSNFYVDNEAMKYRLSVSGYTGTAGDSLAFHDGMYFSTFDRDNDDYSGNLAVLYKGAWWYKDTYYSNLNGMWGSRSNEGVVWYNTTGWQHPVSFTKMMIRRG